MVRLCRLITAATFLLAGAALLPGCGVTRSSDTMRTATEQLLISDAIDRAVQTMDLKALAGQKIFLDDSKLTDTVDRNYYISTLRQQLLANGCELRDKRDDADFVVEARAGAIGTDRNDLLFGIPSTTIPQIPLVQPVPAAIPEIPIAKRKDQRGVAKIAVFAYHRATGAPVWQSGIVRQESSANDVWILGAGPFQRGTIYDGTAFAGKPIGNEGPPRDSLMPAATPGANVARESLFTSPQKFAKQTPPAAEQKLVQAAHTEPAPAAIVPTSEAKAASVAAQSPPSTQTAAQTAATVPPGPAPAVPASTSPAGPPPTPPAGISASAMPTATPASSSVYGHVTDAAPVPQPRFNSPR